MYSNSKKAAALGCLALLIATASVTLRAAAAATASEVASEIAVETFTPPNSITTVPPRYPGTRQQLGQEGWVRLNYMVDPKGKPYDITVVDSSNDSAFEREAIASIEQWEYQPAVLNGQPIDAGAGVFITFQLEGGEAGANDLFVKRYKRLMRHLEKDNLVKAAAVYEKLKKSDRNLYEEAYFHLARYSYLKKQDAEPALLYHAVSRAATMDRGRGYLPDALLTKLLFVRLALEIKQNKLANARSTVVALQQQEITAEQHKHTDDVMAQINQIQHSGMSFALTDTVRKDNRGVHSLLHNRFHLRDVTGDVAELHLHCDRGFRGFTYNPDVIYRIAESWKECKLILIGTPGTTYTLVQDELENG